MTLELQPLGVRCNINCRYCYQSPQRESGNIRNSYDMQVMKEAILKANYKFTLFGGEPLLIPKKDLEEIFSWGLENFGQNGIQTNGTLIDADHIRMFKKYNVYVGISIDGPGKLNDIRWAGSVKKTREATQKTQQAITCLCQENIRISLIITLHKGNAVRDKLPIMYEWFRSLDSLGITSVRLHLMEVENKSIREKYGLSIDENIEALLGFARLETELSNLKFSVFQDMENMLLGCDNNVCCIWTACDPYTTSAVQGIEGFGQKSNCGRTNKDGINFVKTNIAGYERYIALYNTPQEYGGCKDCRFFLMCKGHCPGTAINGDWRNKTENCKIWMQLYDYLEKKQIQNDMNPVSRHPLRNEIEKLLLNGWKSGANPRIQGIIQHLKKLRTDAADLGMTCGDSGTVTPQQALHVHDRKHGDHDNHGDHRDTMTSSKQHKKNKLKTRKKGD